MSEGGEQQPQPPSELDQMSQDFNRFIRPSAQDRKGAPAGRDIGPSTEQILEELEKVQLESHVEDTHNLFNEIHGHLDMSKSGREIRKQLEKVGGDAGLSQDVRGKAKELHEHLSWLLDNEYVDSGASGTTIHFLLKGLVQ